LVVPSTLSRTTHVLLVLHGQQRNAEEYCGSWVDWAAQADYIVVCPEFSGDDWPGSAGYNLGNVFADDDGRGAVNPEGEWAFTVVEQVHRHPVPPVGPLRGRAVRAPIPAVQAAVAGPVRDRGQRRLVHRTGP
jgi:hypothetical protein